MTIDKIPASDRATWLSLRGQDVTASVAGALFGVHEYMTPFQLWALKAGRITDDPEETPAMRRGTLLEPVAVELLREAHPDWSMIHNTGPDRVYYRDPAARIGATPDLRVHDPVRGYGLVQIKTVEQGAFRRKWAAGGDGVIEPPLWIAVQALLEAHLTGADWVGVAALVCGYGLDLHEVRIPQNEGVVKRLYERTAEFWTMVGDGIEPSPDFARDGDTLDRLYARDTGTEIDLSGNERIAARVEERAEHKRLIKTHTALVKEIDAEVKAALGEHSAGVLADGSKVTWKSQTRRAYEVKESTFRVLRYPKED